MYTLCEEIGNLSCLERLVLRHNKLERLPQSLVRLTKLDFLDVSNNRLMFAPTALSTIFASSPAGVLFVSQHAACYVRFVFSPQRDKIERNAFPWQFNAFENVCDRVVDIVDSCRAAREAFEFGWQRTMLGDVCIGLLSLSLPQPLPALVLVLIYEFLRDARERPSTLLSDVGVWNAAKLIKDRCSAVQTTTNTKKQQ